MRTNSRAPAYNSAMTSLVETLLALEMKLTEPEIRGSGALAEIIADDFMEFGGSGHIYNKQYAIAVMRNHAPRVFSFEGFEVRELAADVALATYRVQSQSTEGTGGRVSLRSSIWVNRGGRWQVTFHQATMIN